MAKNSIYVEIDALLDTRLALFLDLDQVAARSWLETSYRMRYSDEFWKISQVVTKEEVQKAWSKRDVTLLRKAIRTQVPELIQTIISSIDWGLQCAGEDNYVELTINTAPYELTNEERTKMRELFEYVFPMVRTVKIVHVPIWALSPRSLGETYDLVMFYNFMEWFRTFSERMDDFELGNIHVIAPKIFANLPDEGTEQWKSLAQENVFDFLTGRLWGRCQLSFETIDTFSIALS